MQRSILWFEDVDRSDLGTVGGKNASLGEMVRALGAEGIRVPPGFATTADAYWTFIDDNRLRQRIRAALDDHAAGKADLAATGEGDRRGLSRVGRKDRSRQGRGSVRRHSSRPDP